MARRAIGFTSVGVLAVGLVAAPIAAAAPADPVERAEALLFGAAINRFVAKQLPSTFSVRGDRDAGIGAADVTLVDARYCGSTKAGHGRLVGVLRPASSSETAPAALPALEARDCHGKLDEVARRLAAAPDAGAVAVVELTAEWVPSEVRVSIGDVASGGDGGKPLARTLARAKAAGPLATADTGGLKLETERGSSLAFDLALSFLKDGVLATLTVACPGCAAPAPRAARDRFRQRARRRGRRRRREPAPREPRRRAVQRGRTAGARHGSPVRRDPERSDPGGEGTLSVRGRATSRAVAETALVQIESSGADLRLGEMRADPQLENCGAQAGGASMGCNIRNAARGPAAAALAAAMMQRYRGKLLRALVVPPPFSFEVGGRRMTLRLTPTRASATAGGLVVTGKADVE